MGLPWSTMDRHPPRATYDATTRAAPRGTGSARASPGPPDLAAALGTASTPRSHTLTTTYSGAVSGPGPAGWPAAEDHGCPWGLPFSALSYSLTNFVLTPISFAALAAAFSIAVQVSCSRPSRAAK